MPLHDVLPGSGCDQGGAKTIADAQAASEEGVVA